MAREIGDQEAVKRFLDAMKCASGCAWQLAHLQQNPAWLNIRDMLDNIHHNTALMAAARAVKRDTALKLLDHRQARAN